jgi:hypothetical protein
MQVNRNGHRIATTLGELIAMISDVAFEYSDDTKEAYHLSRLVLVEILKRSSPKGAIVDWHFSTSKYLH